MSTDATPVYKDPNFERLYNDLLKLNMKNLAPDESSETWEVVKHLYKKERRKRLKWTLTQIAIALSATVAVGALIYKSKAKEKIELPVELEDEVKR